MRERGGLEGWCSAGMKEWGDFPVACGRHGGRRIGGLEGCGAREGEQGRRKGLCLGVDEELRMGYEGTCVRGKGQRGMCVLHGLRGGRAGTGGMPGRGLCSDGGEKGGLFLRGDSLKF